MSLPYRVEFENYGPGSLNPDGTPVSPGRWATAPAQMVTVSNPLSIDLDWTTVSLTSFGFGSTLISLPQNAQSYQITISMNYNGRTFDVVVELGLNLATGTIFTRFQSIDPLTSLPPDVLTGFLPPEDGGGRGKGFFTYTVKPKSGLPSGRRIENVALISFDNQTLISTDQIDPLDPSQGYDPARRAPVTIDASIPSSQVLSLPPTTSTASFMVRWLGQDEPLGSGLASYDVYVSDNNGAYTLWQSQSTQTQANFTGVNGHTYRFYSVARDNVGHIEAAPGLPDAFTTISAGPSLQSITVNDGNAQRSMVNSITVTFDRAVLLEKAAFQLTIGNTPVTFNYVVANPSGDRKTYIVTFSGSGVVAGSIADGLYKLSFRSDRIRDVSTGAALSSNTSFLFHRLFGDTDGDGDVDSLDYGRMAHALGSNSGSSGYVWWLDFDNSGSIDQLDALQVRSRLGNVILPRFKAH